MYTTNYAVLLSSLRMGSDKAYIRPVGIHFSKKINRHNIIMVFIGVRYIKNSLVVSPHNDN